jgi:hypothetical protein
MKYLEASFWDGASTRTRNLEKIVYDRHSGFALARAPESRQQIAES